ncbi:MAG: imidazoleglycerol-phosphate dehydratase HisB [Dehalococcoidia bacterium]
MDKRISRVERETAETNITVEFDVDGSGLAEVNTGIGFYDHMFNAFAKHGRFNLNIEAKGDLHVDAHHTMEDVAICVGQAINQSLGDRAGINRMASSIVPLDEALVQVVLDISGRPFSSILFDFVGEQIGEVPTEMVSHVFGSLASAGKLTLHVNQLAGSNDHHIAEAAMKAFGRALDTATMIDERIIGQIPSTKETLTS